MEAIRNIIDVNDKKITINLPKEFRAAKAEIIILPYTDDEEKIESPAGSIIDFFQQSPLHEEDLDIERTTDYGRDIEL